MNGHKGSLDLGEEGLGRERDLVLHLRAFSTTIFTSIRQGLEYWEKVCLEGKDVRSEG